ncbi:hypothetical protein BU15DRAFT_65240 [Melanogaster broomeanus]|nr:hypothetical protein BU15DRAFT_65240 [Melanogaster broomeanus]
MTQPSAKNKPGFAKILGCVMQAKKHSLNYIWMDTCCIDKTNNTELQEAINSMWNWYQDCDSGQRPDADDSDFSRSQWFRRGWTLQELLAPGRITFFAEDWERIGKKANQNIYEAYYSHHWSTTKKEDKAYSLMGIFDITLPNYLRRQRKCVCEVPEGDYEEIRRPKHFRLDGGVNPSDRSRRSPHPSPAYFADVNEISDEDFVKDFAHMIKPDSRPLAHYSHTNLGIQITLPMKRVEGKDDLFIAMLRCALPDKPDRPLCIYLQPLTGARHQWVRTRISELIPAPMDDKLFENTQIFVKEDMSFFQPKKRKRALSTDTAPRSSSVVPAPTPMRRAVQESPVVPEVARLLPHPLTPPSQFPVRRRRRRTSLADSSRRGFSCTGQFSVEEPAAPEVPPPTTDTHRLRVPIELAIDQLLPGQEMHDASVPRRSLSQEVLVYQSTFPRHRPPMLLLPFHMAAEQTVSSQEMLTTIAPLPLLSRGHLNGFVN